MEKNRHFRALLTVVLFGYISYIISFLLVLYTSKAKINLDAGLRMYYLLAFACIGALILGLALRKEWARKGVMVLAIIVFIFALKFSLGSMARDFMVVKMIKGEFGLISKSLRLVVLCSVSITALYFAMAYPASSPKSGESPPEESLPSAK
jgi:hypothetical protein